MPGFCSQGPAMEPEVGHDYSPGPMAPEVKPRPLNTTRNPQQGLWSRARGLTLVVASGGTESDM